MTHWIIARWSGSLWLAGTLTALQILVLPRSYSFPKLLLYPVAALALDRYARRPSTRKLMMLAGCTVVAFLIRYDHGLFIALGFSASIVVTHWTAGARAALRRLSVYVLIGLLLIAPYLVYIQWVAGLVPYVRDTMSFSRAESQHYPVILPRFVIEPSTAILVERPSATFHVQWTPGTDDAVRTMLEQRLNLTPDARLDDRTWRYRITDLSAAAIEKIVRDAAVEDTSGVDRRTYDVDPERRICRLRCVAAGPGLHPTQNAQAWLYYLAWISVAAGAAVSIAGSVTPVASIVALTVMTALASSTFVRIALAVRLADVWGGSFRCCWESRSVEDGRREAGGSCSGRRRSSSFSSRRLPW